MSEFVIRDVRHCAVDDGCERSPIAEGLPGVAESLYSVIVTAAVSRASSAEEEVHMIISCCTARWLALLSPCRGPCCPLCRMAVLVLSVI